MGIGRRPRGGACNQNGLNGSVSNRFGENSSGFCRPGGGNGPPSGLENVWVAPLGQQGPLRSAPPSACTAIRSAVATHILVLMRCP